jgi:hypothetical protein
MTHSSPSIPCRLSLTLLVIAMCVGAGCRKAARPEAYKNQSDERRSERSPNLEIDFYIDASKSMRGFRADSTEKSERGCRTDSSSNDANHFTDILRQADAILSDAWAKTTLRYWKFGSGAPRPVASIRDFSRDSGLFTDDETHIEQAIQHETEASAGGQAQLKIILTDLYQHDEDAGRLATALNKRYLQNDGSAVGVLAIRSSFCGRINDLSNHPGMIPPGGADSLPFYLLIAGAEADVERAIERLERGMGMDSLPEEDRFHVVFSRSLVPAARQRLAVEAVKKDSPGFDEAAKKNAPGFDNDSSMISGAREQAVPQIAVHQRVVGLNQNLLLSAEDAAQVRDPLLGLAATLKPAVLTWAADKKQWVPAPDSAVAAFHIKSRKLHPATPEPYADRGADKQLRIGEVDLTLDAQSLPKGAFYLVQYDLMVDEDRVPELAAWNIEDNEANRIVQAGKFESVKDGTRPGRTPSLRFFLQTIADRVFQSPVVLARYYLYIKIV